MNHKYYEELVYIVKAAVRQPLDNLVYNIEAAVRQLLCIVIYCSSLLLLLLH